MQWHVDVNLVVGALGKSYGIDCKSYYSLLMPQMCRFACTCRWSELPVEGQQQHAYQVEVLSSAGPRAYLLKTS